MRIVKLIPTKIIPSLILLLGLCVMGPSISAQDGVFGNKPSEGKSGYSLSMKPSIALGEPMDATVGYQNPSRGPVTVEHPRTLILEFTLKRIDTNDQESGAHVWSGRHDGRLNADTSQPDMVIWDEVPPAMVAVAGGGNLTHDFDLQQILAITAIEPGRYRLSVTWGESDGAVTENAEFNLSIAPTGESERYLQELKQHGSPVEKLWAQRKLSNNGSDSQP